MEQKKHTEASWGDVGRKLFGFLYSMKFSIVLLAIILVACVAGSIIPQGADESAYIAEYGSAGNAVIQTLSLDRIFTCSWFVVLAVLLCINLVLCSIIRFPQLVRRYKNAYSLDKRLERQDASFCLPLSADKNTLASLGIRGKTVTAEREETTYHYIVKNRVGLWGSWICHLGMLLLIIGFGLGRMLTKEFVVYGIPGSEQPMGDSGYTLRIDSFDVSLREDYTVEQYTAGLTVISPDGQTVSGTASVNHPMSAFGMSLYQDSTGWANYLDITCDGDLVKQDLLCAGEYTAPDQLPSLIFLLRKFYPDLVQKEDGSLYSQTPICNNPQSLYGLYYEGQMLTMGLAEMGQEITVDRFGFTLHDPVQYTLIVIRTDPTAWFVGIASLLMVVGIVLAFYCRTQEYWTDGKRLWVRVEKAPGLVRQQLEQTLGISAEKEHENEQDTNRKRG